MAVHVKLFVIMLICGFITDAMCYNMMPKPKDCKNDISERKCRRKLENKYKDNIYAMCFGDSAEDDCCKFCLDKLTKCDNYNPYTDDIVDMNIQFTYLTMDCKDTMKYSQCMDVRNKAYNKDTKAMCQDQKYAGMCCTFCRYGMGKDWDSLYVNEWLKHPNKQIQNILDNVLGDGYGGNYGGNGGNGNGGNGKGNNGNGGNGNGGKSVLRGFDNNIGNIVKSFGNDGKNDGGLGNGVINDVFKRFGGIMDIQRSKLAPSGMPNGMPNELGKEILANVNSMSLIKDMNVKDTSVRKRRDTSEGTCEDRIGTSTCHKVMMSKVFKHGGMPHIFCANPHNMVSCCQYCASAEAKGLANRKRRDLAFQGMTEYPKDDDLEPCEDDKLSKSACNNFLYSKFKGSKREMCITVHFGNVCCDSCKKYYKR